LRVGEEVRHLLARIFDRGALADPVLHDRSITVTEVQVSPDLRRATAYVSLLGTGPGPVTDALMVALKRSAPAIRYLIGRDLALRAVPDLVFRADTVLHEAQHIESLLRSPKVRRDLTGAPDEGQAEGAGPAKGMGLAAEREPPDEA